MRQARECLLRVYLLCSPGQPGTHSCSSWFVLCALYQLLLLLLAPELLLFNVLR